MDARYQSIMSAIQQGNLEAAKGLYNEISEDASLENFSQSIEIAILKMHLGEYSEAKKIIAAVIQSKNNPKPREIEFIILLLIQVEKLDGNYISTKIQLDNLYQNYICKLYFSSFANQELLFAYLTKRGISIFEEIIPIVLFKRSHEISEDYLQQLSFAKHYLRQAYEIHEMLNKTSGETQSQYHLLLAYYGLIQVLYANPEKKPSMFRYLLESQQVLEKMHPGTPHMRKVNIFILKALYFLYMSEYQLGLAALTKAKEMVHTLLSFQGEHYTHPLMGGIHVLKARIYLNLGFSVAAEHEMGNASSHLQMFSDESQHWVLQIGKGLDSELKKCMKISYTDTRKLLLFSEAEKEIADSPSHGSSRAPNPLRQSQ